MANAINNLHDVLEVLKSPLNITDIEWRVQSATEKNGVTKVLVLPYITSRAVMNRLDEAVGPYWQDAYQTIGTAKSTGFRCILSLKVGDEWISREDASDIPDIEEIKGGYSNALKRAGAKWGIGRYLYDLQQYWVPLNTNGEHYVGGKFTINKQEKYITGYFNTPKLPKWALPKLPNSQNSNPPANQSSQTQQSNKQGSNQSPMPESKEERQKNALAHVTGALQYLEIPLNLVPHLLETASGCKASLEQASADDLGKLYSALNPVCVYVKSCLQMGLDKEGILYYAQIILAKPFQEIYELPFNMMKEQVEKTLELVRADRQPNNQSQAQGQAS
ncbi:Rad52/Rad22 family DNA repair protein [Psychrobacillus sp. FSL H8-0510]|uniref:Rad52/Rad22 family DNA repair protein n=1 Tax=Psychrobacillus sp. FSL H8-0510 TaxID=2921394 RepID=UPI0030F77526